MINSQVGASLKFYVLQDAHGRVQLVIKPSENTSTPIAGLDDVPLQSVVMVQGKVGLRRGSAIRCNVSVPSWVKVLYQILLDAQEPTGAIEVLVNQVQVLNPADTELPFAPHDEFNLVN